VFGWKHNFDSNNGWRRITVAEMAGNAPAGSKAGGTCDVSMLGVAETCFDGIGKLDGIFVKGCRTRRIKASVCRNRKGN